MTIFTIENKLPGRKKKKLELIDNFKIYLYYKN